MKELIDFIVGKFVPAENYEIIVLEDTDAVDYKVLVDQAHIARVIGRAGKTSKAIRTLVRAASGRGDKDISVHIEER